MDNEQPNVVTDLENLAKAIQVNLVTHLPHEGGSESRSYSFRDPQSEREFEIRQFEYLDDAGKERDRYFVSEFIPNGRICETNKQGHVTRAWDEPRIKEIEAQVGPNALMAKLREAGVNTSGMVRVGGGLGIDSRYHPTLEECSRQIADVLLSNTRYKDVRVPTEQEKVKRAVAQARSSHEFWLTEQRAFKRANEACEGLFKGCTDMMGTPLDKARKDAILGYLNTPSQEKWLEIRGLIVTGSGTLWQAWGKYDPDAPRSGDEGFPTPDVLREALRTAVENRAKELEDRLVANSGTHMRVV